MGALEWASKSDLEIFRRLRVWPVERGLIDIAGIDAPPNPEAYQL